MSTGCLIRAQRASLVEMGERVEFNSARPDTVDDAGS